MFTSYPSSEETALQKWLNDKINGLEVAKSMCNAEVDEEQIEEIENEVRVLKKVLHTFPAVQKNALYIKIKGFGAFNYPVKKVLKLVDVEDTAKFIADFEDPESDVFKAYEAGKIDSEFAIDNTLHDKAKAGDLDALKKLELRKLTNGED